VESWEFPTWSGVLPSRSGKFPSPDYEQHSRGVLRQMQGHRDGDSEHSIWAGASAICDLHPVGGRESGEVLAARGGGRGRLSGVEATFRRPNDLRADGGIKYGIYFF